MPRTPEGSASSPTVLRPEQPTPVESAPITPDGELSANIVVCFGTELKVCNEKFSNDNILLTAIDQVLV